MTILGAAVIDFLLRDPDNPSSVLTVIERARNNARSARTALTREVWEATNSCWLQIRAALSTPVEARDLNNLLGMIRRESAIVRGVLTGTMMRNDIYNFARLRTFVERADNTARILDVKYYVLLPSAMHVGSRLDNVQWETILRALAAQRSFHWQASGTVSAAAIAKFGMLDRRMPRSLAFCYWKIAGLSNDLVAATAKLAAAVDEQKFDDLEAHMRYCVDTIRPLMDEVRAEADALEGKLADSYWPLPKYREMLFIR